MCMYVCASYSDTALVSNHHTLGGVDVSDPVMEVVDGEAYWTSVQYSLASCCLKCKFDLEFSSPP